MEVYAGLDLHSTNTYVAMIDGDNRVLATSNGTAMTFLLSFLHSILSKRI